MTPYHAMPRYLVLLLLLILAASCSRQPVRVEADPSGVLPPASPPAAATDPTPERAPEAADNGTVPLPEGGPVRDTTSLPAEDGLGANPTPDLQLPRPATETNQTAEIERQGSLGEAPLGGDPKELVPGEGTRLQLTQGSCFGPCDVYTLQLNDGNDAVLQVLNGLMGPGTYRLQLDEDAVAQLAARMDLLRDMDLALQYPDDPDAELPMDAQVTTVTLPDAEGNLRRVVVYYDAPPALDRLIEEVQAFVEDAARRQNSSDR